MRYCLAALLLVALFSCSKEKSDPYASARDITGNVVVFDEFGTSSNDVIGITVTISNGVTNLTTQTIQNGRFLFNMVPYGTYTLAVSRAGYGTSKRLGIQHQRPLDSASFPLQLSPINLTQLSTTTITFFNAAAIPNGGFNFWVGISPATAPGSPPRYFSLFVGKDSLVAWDNAEIMTPSLAVTGSGTSGALLAALTSHGFQVGQTAWVRAYGDASPNNMYYDSSQLKWIYPCINLSTQPAIPIVLQ